MVPLEHRVTKRLLDVEPPALEPPLPPPAPAPPPAPPLIRRGAPPLEAQLTEADHGLSLDDSAALTLPLAPDRNHALSAHGGWSPEGRGRTEALEGIFVAVAAAGRPGQITGFHLGPTEERVQGGARLYAFTVADRKGVPLTGTPGVVVREDVPEARAVTHKVKAARHPLLLEDDAVLIVEPLDPEKTYRVRLAGGDDARVVSLWERRVPRMPRVNAPRLDGPTQFSVKGYTRAKLALLRGTSPEPVRVSVQEQPPGWTFLALLTSLAARAASASSEMPSRCSAAAGVPKPPRSSRGA